MKDLRHLVIRLHSYDCRFRKSVAGKSDKLAPVRLFLLAAVILSVCASAPGSSKKKPGDVEVLETKARRVDDKITLDAACVSTSEKPTRRLVIIFRLPLA